MYFNNLTKNETKILDQAWSHYCATVDQYPDLIPVASTSYRSVNAIAKLFAEASDDFRNIFNDMNKLVEIDKELKARIDRETESIHGKFYYGQHDHLFDELDEVTNLDNDLYS